jgi:hypothetical protein
MSVLGHEITHDLFSLALGVSLLSVQVSRVWSFALFRALLEKDAISQCQSTGSHEEAPRSMYDGINDLHSPDLPCKLLALDSAMLVYKGLEFYMPLL